MTAICPNDNLVRNNQQDSEIEQNPYTNQQSVTNTNIAVTHVGKTAGLLWIESCAAAAPLSPSRAVDRI